VTPAERHRTSDFYKLIVERHWRGSTRQTTLLRILIKEVTLGTHGRMNQKNVGPD
jgi:hypothetical protein